ncbi:alanine/ornithine racemase family PLP-dependent enzyme [Nitrincola sp. MINF-07-Sa-05]|uniref:alanine/ornithine racemase family PLP-dependent enzyme n=1 Tax=Nitrincola salilacus TaxID=3400273 RepID=UPI003917E725
MTAPRLDIDLDKIYHNACSLVRRLAARGISVTGVTKASLGSTAIANTFLRAGVTHLGDSRIDNIEAMHREHITAPMMLIRSPMLSQVTRVVRHSDMSVNTEMTVIRALSAAAGVAGCTHGIMLMVELGDLREGIMPADLEHVAREVVRLPHVRLCGIGTNLACQSGVVPDSGNMDELSALAETLEATLGVHLAIISGGNSANLDWALGASVTGRINNLRLGESILLGCEPLHRQPIDGLYTDAITFVAEVIEQKLKPSQSRGHIAQTAFGDAAQFVDRGRIVRTILAVGHQDIDPGGLSAPIDMTILGTSSDHLVLDPGNNVLSVGDEIRFGVNYSALMKAMTSRFVIKAERGGKRGVQQEISGHRVTKSYQEMGGPTSSRYSP